MIRSAAGVIVSEQAVRSAERLYFVDEQNIRRALGPALWHSLADAVAQECAHANEHVRDIFRVERSPLSLSVRHTSGRVLRLDYREAGPDRHSRFRTPAGQHHVPRQPVARAVAHADA
jgi:hypothetical protein